MKNITIIQKGYCVALIIFEISIYLSNDMYLPAILDVAKTYAISFKLAQLSLTFWLAGLACAFALVHNCVMFFGRRKFLLVSNVLFIFSTLVCAVAKSYKLFLLGRFIEGAMTPALLVAGYATIHSLFDEKEAVKILAALGAISILAPAFGPLLGGILLLHAPWQYLFYYLVASSGISLIGLYCTMPETDLLKKSDISIFLQYKQLLKNKLFLQYAMSSAFLLTGILCWIYFGPALVMQQWQQSKIALGLWQTSVFAALILGSCIVSKWTNYLSTQEIRQSTDKLYIFILFICPLSTFLIHFSAYFIFLPMSLFALANGLIASVIQRQAVDRFKNHFSIDTIMTLFFFLTTSVAAFISNLLVFLNTPENIIWVLLATIFVLTGLTRRISLSIK